MRKRRFIIGLLVTIALQYSTAASMADGFGCRHAGMGHVGVAVVSGVPQQHDHAAMQHMAHAQHAIGDQNCDCPMQCDCADHCAGGGCSAALTVRDIRIASNDRVELNAGPYRNLVSDPQTNPPFRPPIVAVPGAT